MKKFFVFVLTFFILFVSSNMSLFAATPKKGYVKNTKKNSLAVRKKPNPKSKVVAKLYAGTNVDITKKSGKWLKVKSGSTKGWIKKKFIKVTEYDYSTSSGSVAGGITTNRRVSSFNKSASKFVKNKKENSGNNNRKDTKDEKAENNNGEIKAPGTYNIGNGGGTEVPGK